MATYKVKSKEREFTVTVVDTAGGATVTVDGQAFDVQPVGVPAPAQPAATAVPAPPSAPLSTPSPMQAAAPAAIGSGAIAAPIPGVVTEVCVKEGDQVSAGQVVLKLEAMKMENDISTPVDGTVKEVHVAAGAEVSDGQLLVTVA